MKPRTLVILFNLVLAVALLMVAGGNAQAALLAHESFESYPPGSGGSLIGQNGGIGWAGPWLPGTGNVADVADTSEWPLTFTPAGGAEINGNERAGEFSATANVPTAVRLFEEELPDVFYAAYLLRTVSGSWGGNNTFSIHFTDSPSNVGNSLNFGIRAGTSGVSLVDHFMVRTGTGNPPEGGGTGGFLEQWNTHYLVARISKLDANDSPSVTYDRIELWLDPEADANVTTPTGDARLQLSSGERVSAITHLVVRAAALQTDDLVQMDELTIATGWPLGLEGPPQILNLIPGEGAMFVNPADPITFNVVSDSPVPQSDIRLVLNDEDLSESLSVTGTANQWNVSLAGLEAGRIYQGEITVTSGSLTVRRTLRFDTFSEDNLMIEAEDFNFEEGQFFDNPSLCNDFGGGPDCYFDRVGVQGIDALKHGASVVPPERLYRWGSWTALEREEPVDTTFSDDFVRSHFADAPAGGGGVIRDYDVTTISAEDWFNYTRTFPEGHYHIYLRTRSTAAQSVRLSKVSNPTVASQTASTVGVFQIPASGGGYTMVPLTDTEGRQIAIPFGGVETVRLTALSANNNLQLNFLLFVPTEAEERGAFISSVTPPDGLSNVSPGARISVEIANADTSAQQATIRLMLDGADVTSQADIQPTATGFLVEFKPAFLLPGTRSASVAFQDTEGATISSEWEFAVANVPLLEASWAAPAGSVSTPGFNVRSAQSTSEEVAALPRTLARAEDQLAGNVQVDHTGTDTPDVLNYKERADIGDQGYFTAARGFPDRVAQEEGLILPDDHDNFAVEATFFLDLTPGFVELGVNVNDAFQLRAGSGGNGPEDFPLVLGQRDSEGAATEERPQFPANFIVTQPGVYAFRLVWVEYVGTSSVELHVKDSEGESHLVNAEDSPFQAFRVRTQDPSPSEPARMTVELNANGSITIRWDSPGTLQSAPSIPGTWTNVESAGQELTLTPEGTTFYRIAH